MISVMSKISTKIDELVEAQCDDRVTNTLTIKLQDIRCLVRK